MAPSQPANTSPNRWEVAVAGELDRLDTPLQQATAVAILERRLTGRGFDNPDFWARTDVCARSTYHKWRKHTNFADVLEAAWDIARTYRSQIAADALMQAVEDLQMATPAFVEAIKQVAQDSANDFARIQAAFGGLDRASELTAPKGQPSAVNERTLQHVMVTVYGKEPGRAGENRSDSEEEPSPAGEDDASTPA